MAMLPEGWSAHDLGDLAQKIEGGGTPPRNEPSYWDGDIPWASVKDLRGVKLSTTEEFISELGLENSSSKLIPSNTMIIASRMAVGKAVFFNQDVAINQDLKAFYPKENTDGLFLLQWYLSQSEKIESLATGSTVKGIRLDDLTLLPIDLPPLPEQQKIATILSSVDNVIEKTRAQIDKLKDLKTGMMQELLTKGIGHTEFKDSPVGRIPVGWSVKCLPDVSVNHDSKRVPIKSVDRANIEGSYRYYGASGVIDYVNDYIFDGTYILLGEDGENVLSRNLPLAFIVSGKFWVNNHAHVLTAKPNMDINFLCEYLESIDYTNIASGSAQPKITQGSLNSILVPIPPIDEQRTICSVLKSIDKRVEFAAKKLGCMHLNKKALMQDLLTGKVRVKLTDKESAAR